jgi:hypothetical protein
MNNRCPDFTGRYTCDHFITNGACKMQTRFMCHIFTDEGKQPVMDDIPEHVGRVLEEVPSATVVEELDSLSKGMIGFMRVGKMLEKAKGLSSPSKGKEKPKQASFDDITDFEELFGKV